MEDFGEKLKVACVFENGKLRPTYFWRGEKIYRVLKVEFCYFKDNGRERIFYFSVVSDRGNFEISFNRERFSWWLEKAFG